MSRKDYVLFANHIRRSTLSTSDLTLIATFCATIFEQDNPRFDRPRFLKAALAHEEMSGKLTASVATGKVA